jgi:hypothetical protein
MSAQSRRNRPGKDSWPGSGLDDAMLSNDMIDLEGQVECVPGDLTIFTPPTGPLPYEVF